MAPKPVIHLLIGAATGLRDEIMNEIEFQDSELQPITEVPVFDNLDPRPGSSPWPTSWSIYATDLPSPDLYAWNEGTLSASFGG